MTLQQFIERVINDGISAARKDYAGSDEKLSGSIAGFESCRGKSPAELAALLRGAEKHCESLRRHNIKDDYWFHRCRHLEIEWVCNVVSAVLVNEGAPPIVTPTARGTIKAATIINSKVGQDCDGNNA